MMFFHKWSQWQRGNVYMLPLTPEGPSQEFVAAQVVDQDDGPTIVLTRAVADEVSAIYCGKDERAAADDLAQFFRDFLPEGSVVEFTQDEGDYVCKGSHGIITSWSDDRFYVELDDPPEGLAAGEVSVCLNAPNLLAGLLPGLVRVSDGTDSEQAEQETLALRARLAGIGFQWQPDAGNYVRDIPADLGRAYIESAGAPWSSDEGEPGPQDGPVRLVFLVLGQEDATGGWEEIEIASLQFDTLKDALAAWEARS